MIRGCMSKVAMQKVRSPVASLPCCQPIFKSHHSIFQIYVQKPNYHMNEQLSIFPTSFHFQ